jgi:transcriptional regulator with XRE-family HTH domain
MLETPEELAAEIGARVRARRLALNITQGAAAARAGVSYAAWRRLEASGAASLDVLVRAAIALRAEEGLRALFPALPVQSLDALIAPAPRKRASRR